MLSGFGVYNPNLRPVGVCQLFLIRQMAISSANRFLSDSPSAARSCVLEDTLLIHEICWCKNTDYTVWYVTSG